MPWPEARLLRPYVSQSKPTAARGRPTGRRHHRLVRQDDDQRVRGPLVGGSMSVVASPASFNNTAGLARAINEHLATGTQVFVAEMGTYGPGEIAAMCAWAPPEVAVITALGPVHLERMRTLETHRGGKSRDPRKSPRRNR